MEWTKIKTPLGIVYGVKVNRWQFIGSLEADGTYHLTAKIYPNAGTMFDLGEFNSMTEIDDAINMFASVVRQ